MKLILLIVLAINVYLCFGSQETRLNICRTTVNKNFAIINKYVGDISECKDPDCYSNEVCDEAYREAEHELSETIRSRVNELVTVIQTVFKQLQSKYRDLTNINQKVKELSERQKELKESETQMLAEKKGVESEVGVLTDQLNKQKEDLVGKRNEWKDALTKLEKEQEAKSVELKGLSEKLDVEVKDFVEFAKSIKTDSESCSKQLNEVLLFLANFASKKDAILRAEALTNRFNTLKSQADQQLKIIANNLFTSSGKGTSTEFLAFISNENLYNNFEEKIKGGQDISISLADGMAIWDRTLTITQNSYAHAEKFFKEKAGINLIANRMMRYKSRYLALSKIVEGIPEEITKKHETSQRQFLDTSIQVDKDITFLENLQVLFLHKLKSVEEAIIKANGEASALEESIKSLELSVEQLGRAISNAKAEKIKLDNEIKETLKTLEKERASFEASQTSLQTSIQGLLNNIQTTCGSIDVKKLRAPFQELQGLIAQIGLKVHEVDAYNQAMEQLIANSKFNEIISAAESIRKIHVEVSRKITVYLSLLKQINSSDKKVPIDKTCLLMGLYGTKTDIEASTKEIKDLFKNLNTIGGSGADELMKKKLAEAKALNEKHKRGDEPEQLKSLEELDTERER